MPLLHDGDLSGRTALITGANHGIGRATARLLADMGASVVVSYLRTTAAQHFPQQYPETYQENRRLDGLEVARSIEATGGSALAIEADLLADDAVPMLFDEAEKRFGVVDILVNNATGQCANDSFADKTRHGKQIDARVTGNIIDKTFGVDVKAGALLITEFARRSAQREARWGRIIGLTSGGPMGFPGEVTYGAAKVALENYTMSAALELGDCGITANMVYPPVTDTGWLTEDVRQFVTQSPDHFHVAEPIDVARVIGFLCTDAASMITGNVIRMR